MRSLVYLSFLYGALPSVLGEAPNLNSRQIGVDPVRPIEYLESDGNGHVKGDIHIQLPQEVATSTNDFFGFRHDTCPATKKRAPDGHAVDCLFEDLQDTIFNLGQGRGLNALVGQFQGVPQDLAMPNFQDEVVAAAYGRFVPYAGDHLPQYAPDLAEAALIPVATFLFFLVTAELVKGAAFVGKDLFLSAKDFVSTVDFHISCPDINSPFAPTCSRFYCKGEAGKCTSPIMKPCDCVPTECPYPDDMYSCADCAGKNGYCTEESKKNCQCISSCVGNGLDGSQVWTDSQISINNEVGLYVAPPPKEPVISDGSGSGTCGNGKTTGDVGINSKKIDKNTLQKCLKNLDTSKWLDAAVGQAFDCDGMVSFQSASKSWNSPGDCWNSCKNCLSQSIEDGVNQVWCDAYAGIGAHCWLGYIIPDPPAITDGSSWSDDQQRIDHSDGWIDKYAAQDCLKKLPTDHWIGGDAEVDCNNGMIKFGAGSSHWDSMGDCYNALKNCVSDAINKGATEAWCDAYAGFNAHCWLGFHKP